MRTYSIVKRILDVVFSLIALIATSPIILLIVVLIKLDSKGPVLFKQKRIGKHKSHFYILKFRTMKTQTPKEMPTHMLQNAECYITGVGKVLRKTSLDELPQIINIIKGDMSIVGPRPALWNQEDLILARDNYGANDILPGLTGWAQVNGRDELSIDAKASFDGEYVRIRSIAVDLRIIIKTVLSVVKKEGIREGEFRSSKKEANF